jgi:hypothetical protein
MIAGACEKVAVVEVEEMVVLGVGTVEEQE